MFIGMFGKRSTKSGLRGRNYNYWLLMKHEKAYLECGTKHAIYWFICKT